MKDLTSNPGEKDPYKPERPPLQPDKNPDPSKHRPEKPDTTRENPQRNDPTRIEVPPKTGQLKNLAGNSACNFGGAHGIIMQTRYTKGKQFLGLLNCPLDAYLSYIFICLAFFYFL
jgi:hypothetical protein